MKYLIASQKTLAHLQGWLNRYEPQQTILLPKAEQMNEN